MNERELYLKLKPHIARDFRPSTVVQTVISGGGGATSFGALSGTIANAQAPQFLLRDGTRSVTGNLAVDAGITIDGVDISAHAADPDAHHARSHSITGASDHTVTGAAWDVVGLSATNTLAVLNSSNSPGATEKLVRTATDGSINLRAVISSVGGGSGGAIVQGVVDTETSFARAFFGHNAQYDSAANLWTMDPIGANDASGLLLTNSAASIDLIFHATTGNTSRTMTHAEFTAGKKFSFTRTNGFTTDTAFVSGFTGSGLRLDDGVAAAGKTTLELDDMVLRGRLRVYELLIHQIRATNGSVFVTGVGKAKTVTGSGPYTITTDTDHGFAVNDLIRAQRFTGSGVYQCNMQVTGVATTTQFTATLSGGDVPAAGMDFVRLGNTTDTTKQGSIYLTADDTYAPYIDILDGVDSFANWGAASKIKVRLGKLSGISDATLSPTGYGLYSQNAYLKGTVSAASDVVRLDDDGVRVKATTTSTYASANAYRFADAGSVEMGGLYGRDYGSAFTIGLDAYGDATRQALVAITAKGGAAAGGTATAVAEARNPAGTKLANITLNADNSASYIIVGAADYTQFNMQTRSSSGGHRPTVDLGADLGTASYRWGTLYVNQVIVSGAISGATLSGQEWEYAGSMIIDANSAGPTTVSILNQGAGVASLSVEGNITSTGGFYNGVDLVTFKGSYDGHIANVNAHHNQSHVLATTSALGADHTVSGLTAGQVLRASGATAAAFAQLGHSDLSGLTTGDPHTQYLLKAGGTMTGTPTLNYTDAQVIIRNSTPTAYGALRITAWSQTASLFANLSYSGSGDPITNSVFEVAPGANSTGGGLLRYHGNGRAWEIYDAGVSGGIAAAATLTKIGSLGVAAIWLSPRGTSTDFAISSTGLVGIGTASPQAVVHLHHGTAAALQMTTTGSGATATDGMAVGYSTNAFFWNYENTAMAIATNNTQRLTITAGGDIYAETGAVRSGTYTANTTGWQISNAGAADVRSVTTPSIVTASGNLSINPAGGTTAITGALTGSSTATFTTNVTTPLVTAAAGSLLLNAPTGNLVDLQINSVAQWSASDTRLNPRSSVVMDLGDYNRKLRTLYAAELYVETLVAQDVMATMGGRIMVAPTTTLIADLASSAPIPLWSNMTAYWTLNEASGNRADSKGSQTLTDTNTVTSNTGIQGTAAEFTKANSERLVVSDNATLSVGDIDFYMACWIYPTLDDGTDQFIASKGGGASARSWRLRIDWATNQVKFQIFLSNDTSTTVTASTFGTVAVNTWYFVEAWHDSVGNVIGVAVNGTSNTAAHTTGTWDDAGAFQIGAANSTSHYQGRIDEFGFWKNYIPTAAERTWLYNTGAGRAYAGIAELHVVDVKHNSPQAGDYLYMQTAPGGVPQIEAFQAVTAATAITGGYRYWAKRNLDGTGANSWVAGDAVVNLGGTAGEGYIDLTATSTIHGALGPTQTFYVRTATLNWNDVKPVVTLGNLRSFVDYASDEFGQAGGNDLTLTPTSGFKGYTIDRTNGLRLFNSNLRLYESATLRADFDPADGLNLRIDSSATNKRQQINWWTDLTNRTGAPALSIVPRVDATDGNALRLSATYDGSTAGSTIELTTNSASKVVQLIAQVTTAGLSRIVLKADTINVEGNIGEAWTNVTYTTGWVDFGGGFTGAQYKKVGDLIFLRGLCKRTSGVATTMFTLPVNYRPSSSIIFAQLSNDALARVQVDTTGAVTMSFGTATSWVNLSGIVFGTA